MPVQSLEDLLSKFEEYIPTSKGYKVTCPFHLDKTPSLHLTMSGDKLLVKCFAGCDRMDILDYINGKKIPPAIVEAKAKNKKFKRKVKFGSLSKIYTYRNPSGAGVYQVLRYDNPKSFSFRRISVTDSEREEFGDYIPHISEDTPKYIYNLPRVISAISNSTFVWKVEGEKDADNLTSKGLVGTCNLFGAGTGKWLSEYNTQLAGADVVVIPDEDHSGYQHAFEVALGLLDTARSVRVVFLPVGHKQDVSDYLRGNSVDDLLSLATKAEDLIGISYDDLLSVFDATVDPVTQKIVFSKFSVVENNGLAMLDDIINSFDPEAAAMIGSPSEFEKLQLFTQASELLDAEGAFVGVCPECFGTGFAFQSRGAVFGVLADVVESHEGGEPTITLSPCSHRMAEASSTYDF